MPSILSVIVDSREPDWFKEGLFTDVPVIVQTLDAGDYWVATDDDKILVIERKSPDDFVESIIDGRLFSQAAKLQSLLANGYWVYIIITGQIQRTPDGNCFTGRERKFSWNAVQGAKLSMQELGIFVYECNGGFDFANAVRRLAERTRNEDKLTAPKRKARLANKQVEVLSALPGISIEKAEHILEYCGTAVWALTALTNDIDIYKIPGVGPGMRGNIRFALGMEDWQLLTITEKEKENGSNENE
jgi:DNA excision repair protein ERCC-4